MSTLTEGKRTAEFLLSEGEGAISRDVVTIVAGAGALAAGTVLGKITASGKYKAYASGNSDGSQTAVGVLYAATPSSASDQSAVAVTRMAEVAGALLTGSDATAVTGLKAALVIVRT